jgi:spermidine/putrescine transport system permease protein
VRRRRAAAQHHGVWYPRWFWPSFSAPGVLWIAVLFLVPFYVVLSIAFGTFDPIFRSPVPIWNPAQWYTGTLTNVVRQIFGSGAFLGPPFVRTFVYVGAASAICIVVAYPVAYYTARYAGKRRSLILVLLIAPFWISYMMRMLAWINLLRPSGLVNRSLETLGVLGGPVNWLGGRPGTVILGLTYGYIPYMILPLFGTLDRINTSLLEASRDLGAGQVATFRRVTLPMSRQAILAGIVIVTLPMFGDYFTTTLLAGTRDTTMIGNLVVSSIQSSLVQTGASLVLILIVLLILPMIYYLRATARTELIP